MDNNSMLIKSPNHKKGTRLIFSNYSMSPIAHDILERVILQIENLDERRFRPSYTVNIKEIADLHNSRDIYSSIKKATDDLMNIQWSIPIDKLIGENSTERDGKYFLNLNLVTTSLYDGGKGTIKITLNDNAEPFIIKNPERIPDILRENSEDRNYTEQEKKELLTSVFGNFQYTELNKHFLDLLKKKYSKRMYEITKALVKRKHRRRVFLLKEFRALLGLENKYKEWKSLKKFVLVNSQEELDEKADVRYEFGIESYEGRAVRSIYLEAFYNEKNQILQEDDRTSEDNVVNADYVIVNSYDDLSKDDKILGDGLMKIIGNYDEHISEPKLVELLQKNTPEYLQHYISVYERKDMRKIAKTSVAGYLIKAIEDDYLKFKKIQAAQEQAELKKDRLKKKVSERKRKEEEEEKLNQEYGGYYTQRLTDLFEHPELHTWIDKFLAEFTNVEMYKVHKEKILGKSHDGDSYAKFCEYVQRSIYSFEWLSKEEYISSIQQKAQPANGKPMVKIEQLKEMASQLGMTLEDFARSTGYVLEDEFAYKG